LHRKWRRKPHQPQLNRPRPPNAAAASLAGIAASVVARRE
jgi:hypothetical protein